MQFTVHSESLFVFLLLTCIQFTCCFILPNHMLWYFIASEIPTQSEILFLNKWGLSHIIVFVKKYVKCCGDMSLLVPTYWSDLPKLLI